MNVEQSQKPFLVGYAPSGELLKSLESPSVKLSYEERPTENLDHLKVKEELEQTQMVQIDHGKIGA